VVIGVGDVAHMNEQIKVSLSSPLVELVDGVLRIGDSQVSVRSDGHFSVVLCSHGGEREHGAHRKGRISADVEVRGAGLQVRKNHVVVPSSVAVIRTLVRRVRAQGVLVGLGSIEDGARESGFFRHPGHGHSRRITSQRDVNILNHVRSLANCKQSQKQAQGGESSWHRTKECLPFSLSDWLEPVTINHRFKIITEPVSYD
jgi:hypothetical protein